MSANTDAAVDTQELTASTGRLSATAASAGSSGEHALAADVSKNDIGLVDSAVYTPKRSSHSAITGFHLLAVTDPSSPLFSIQQTSSTVPTPLQESNPTTSSNSVEQHQQHITPPPVVRGVGAMQASEEIPDEHPQRLRECRSEQSHNTSKLPAVVATQCMLPVEGAGSQLQSAQTAAQVDISRLLVEPSSHTPPDAQGVLRTSALTRANEGFEEVAGPSAPAPGLPNQERCQPRRFQASDDRYTSPYLESSTTESEQQEYSDDFECEEDPIETSVRQCSATLLPSQPQTCGASPPFERQPPEEHTPKKVCDVSPTSAHLPSAGNVPSKDPLGAPIAASTAIPATHTDDRTLKANRQVRYTELSDSQLERRHARDLERKLHTYLYDKETKLLAACLRRWYTAMFIKATAAPEVQHGGGSSALVTPSRPTNIRPSIHTPTPVVTRHDTRSVDASRNGEKEGRQSTPGEWLAVSSLAEPVGTHLKASGSHDGTGPSRSGARPLFTSQIKTYTHVYLTPDGRMNPAQVRREGEASNDSSAFPRGDGQELEVMHTDVQWMMIPSMRTASSCSSSFSSSISDPACEVLQRTMERLTDASRKQAAERTMKAVGAGQPCARIDAGTQGEGGTGEATPQQPASPPPSRALKSSVPTTLNEDRQRERDEERDHANLLPAALQATLKPCTPTSEANNMDHGEMHNAAAVTLSSVEESAGVITVGDAVQPSYSGIHDEETERRGSVLSDAPKASPPLSPPPHASPAVSHRLSSEDTKPPLPSLPLWGPVADAQAAATNWIVRNTASSPVVPSGVGVEMHAARRCHTPDESSGESVEEIVDDECSVRSPSKAIEQPEQQQQPLLQPRLTDEREPSPPLETSEKMMAEEAEVTPGREGGRNASIEASPLREVVSEGGRPSPPLRAGRHSTSREGHDDGGALLDRAEADGCLAQVAVGGSSGGSSTSIPKQSGGDKASSQVASLIDTTSAATSTSTASSSHPSSAAGANGVAALASHLSQVARLRVQRIITGHSPSVPPHPSAAPATSSPQQAAPLPPSPQFAEQRSPSSRSQTSRSLLSYSQGAPSHRSNLSSAPVREGHPGAPSQKELLRSLHSATPSLHSLQQQQQQHLAVVEGAVATPLVAEEENALLSPSIAELLSAVLGYEATAATTNGEPTDLHGSEHSAVAHSTKHDTYSDGHHENRRHRHRFSYKKSRLPNTHLALQVMRARCASAAAGRQTILSSPPVHGHSAMEAFSVEFPTTMHSAVDDGHRVESRDEEGRAAEAVGLACVPHPYEIRNPVLRHRGQPGKGETGIGLLFSRLRRGRNTLNGPLFAKHERAGDDAEAWLLGLPQCERFDVATLLELAQHIENLTNAQHLQDRRAGCTGDQGTSQQQQHAPVTADTRAEQCLEGAAAEYPEERERDREKPAEATADANRGGRSSSILLEAQQSPRMTDGERDTSPSKEAAPGENAAGLSSSERETDVSPARRMTASDRVLSPEDFSRPPPLAGSSASNPSFSSSAAASSAHIVRKASTRSASNVPNTSLPTMIPSTAPQTQLAPTPSKPASLPLANPEEVGGAAVRAGAPEGSSGDVQRREDDAAIGEGVPLPPPAKSTAQSSQRKPPSPRRPDPQQLENTQEHLPEGRDFSGSGAQGSSTGAGAAANASSVVPTVPANGVHHPGSTFRSRTAAAEGSVKGGAGHMQGEADGLGLPSVYIPLLSPQSDRAPSRDPPRPAKSKQLLHQSNLEGSVITPVSAKQDANVIANCCTPNASLPARDHHQAGSAEHLSVLQRSHHQELPEEASHGAACDPTGARTPASSALHHEGAPVASVPDGLPWGNAAAASWQCLRCLSASTPAPSPTFSANQQCSHTLHRCRPSCTPRLSDAGADSIASSSPPPEERYLSIQSERRRETAAAEARAGPAEGSGAREPTPAPQLSLGAHLSADPRAAGRQVRSPTRDYHVDSRASRFPIGVMPTTHPYSYQDLPNNAAGMKKRLLAGDTSASSRTASLSSSSSAGAFPSAAKGLVSSAQRPSNTPGPTPRTAPPLSLSGQPGVAAAARPVERQRKEELPLHRGSVSHHLPNEAVAASSPRERHEKSRGDDRRRHCSSRHRHHGSRQARAQGERSPFFHSKADSLDSVERETRAKNGEGSGQEGRDRFRLPMAAAESRETDGAGLQRGSRRHRGASSRHRRPSRDSSRLAPGSEGLPQGRHQHFHRRRREKRSLTLWKREGRGVERDGERDAPANAIGHCECRCKDRNEGESREAGEGLTLSVRHADPRDPRYVWQESSLSPTIAGLHTHPNYVATHPYDWQTTNQFFVSAPQKDRVGGGAPSNPSSTALHKGDVGRHAVNSQREAPREGGGLVHNDRAGRLHARAHHHRCGHRRHSSTFSRSTCSSRSASRRSSSSSDVDNDIFESEKDASHARDGRHGTGAPSQPSRATAHDNELRRSAKQGGSHGLKDPLRDTRESALSEVGPRLHDQKPTPHTERRSLEGDHTIQQRQLNNVKQHLGEAVANPMVHHEPALDGRKTELSFGEGHPEGSLGSRSWTLQHPCQCAHPRAEERSGGHRDLPMGHHQYHRCGLPAHASSRAAEPLQRESYTTDPARIISAAMPYAQRQQNALVARSSTPLYDEDVCQNQVDRVSSPSTNSDIADPQGFELCGRPARRRSRHQDKYDTRSPRGSYSEEQLNPTSRRVPLQADPSSRSPHDAIFDVPTAAQPGDLFYKDDGGAYHRIRDDSELRSILGTTTLASPHGLDEHRSVPPLYVVHYPLRSTSPGARRSRSPALWVPPRRAWTITDPKNPLGCSRLNPYCATCRMRYNLIFVDANMRPLRWPSPQSAELEPMGNCRIHSGYVFGDGDSEFTRGASLTEQRERALYTHEWPARPHARSGQLVVKVEDVDRPLRQLTPPPRGRFIPVSYEAHDADAPLRRPTSLTPRANGSASAVAPAAAAAMATTSSSSQRNMLRSEPFMGASSASRVPSPQRLATHLGKPRGTLHQREEGLRRLYVLPPTTSASTESRSSQQKPRASLSTNGGGVKNSGASPAEELPIRRQHTREGGGDADTAERVASSRNEERRIKKALKQLLWRDLPQQRGTPEWERYVRLLSKELRQQQLL
ncbi:hypothetical protein ABL78_2144 [Leptomonas seymouri]|uniref:Uncharacterized protein n=1 Tax=Leptomonas seymouri TaxID=5684 RepID=A0A0N1HZR1_LEPSE|nr:hypothetical protein ABL78_2144 [Leptomonas seymouri]|eukprot:KPI88765.1 hypothetical protein ABL78_2144 [Leptomonas seymouri]